MNTYRLTVDFETDRDEGDLAYWFEGVMASHGIEPLDLSVYEVLHMPSYAEQERERRGVG